MLFCFAKLDEIATRQRRIEILLRLLLRELRKERLVMDQDFQAMITKVSAAVTVEESAVVLLGQLQAKMQSLADQLTAALNSGDTAKLAEVRTALQAATDGLGAATADLTTAVTANTPAAG